jgi:hypothetical protein
MIDYQYIINRIAEGEVVPKKPIVVKVEDYETEEKLLSIMAICVEEQREFMVSARNMIDGMIREHDRQESEKKKNDSISG